jgi:hypothetical protein
MSVLEATAPENAVADANRLAELEAIVERGLDHYVAVGRALEEIRQRRLYKLSHATFAKYLADRWGCRFPAATA